MKKPAFIVTEIFLSIVLTASVASVAVLAADIRSNGSILPQELFGTTSENSSDKKSESSVPEASKKESSAEKAESEASEEEKTSKASEESDKKTPDLPEESKEEESKPTAAEELKLELNEPKKLKSNPKELTKLINNYGYGYEALGFDHLIVVESGKKSTAKIYCYQKSSKGYWWDIAGSGKAITESGFIGEKGADFDIKPGSKKTPLGFYAISEGFYIGEKPQTTYPLFEITDDTYWVDDTKSKFYNQRVDGTADKDWSSAEHMISSEDSYRYGLVVDYNTSTPADPKLAGSIFMRIGDSATEGSIAVPENVMKAILEWLDNDSNCYIFVTP